MVEQVEAYIEQWNMIGAGDRVVIGVSGGADSVCLCLVLHELSERIGFAMRVVHVEHGIRGRESVRDAAFVERLCDALGLACAVHHVRVPAYAREHRMSEEEAARCLRYAALCEEAKEERGALQQPGTVRIALAHHMEDNAETMLLQLVRGTGLDGLCGMQPVRTDEDGFVYIRPLLSVSRSAIEAFLAARGQGYCQDATNGELAHSRNRIRHRVMPELTAVNEQAIAHMNQTAERLLELRGYLDAETEKAYAYAVELRGPERPRLYLHGDRLFTFPQVLVSRVIHRAVAEAAGARKDIAAVHIRSVQSLFAAQCGHSIDLPCQVVASRVYEGICLCKRAPDDAAEERAMRRNALRITPEMLAECAKTKAASIVPCGADGEQIVLRAFSYEGNQAEISTKMYTKWFDYDKIKDGFSIRSRENGDYFVMDETGHRKRLERYFIDQKIPLEQRDCILLLVRGEEVLWVIGGRMGRGGMVTEDTRTILEVAYQP